MDIDARIHVDTGDTGVVSSFVCSFNNDLVHIYSGYLGI